jgi:16S rRNA (guanine527-N7)-methyltransferase
MLSSRQITLFKEICSGLNISLSERMVDKFQAYGDLLLDWNKRVHLVSKRDAESSRILRHFVDSLSIFRAIDPPTKARLLDLGSGAGFPAIPIKIVREDVETTLVESIHKKTLFLHKLTKDLNLQGISIFNQRAENILKGEGFAEGFDLVTAKALGNLKYTVRLGMPLLKAGGLLVAYKSEGGRREIDEIATPKDHRIKDVVGVQIPNSDLLRWLVVIEKVAQNPRQMSP